MPVPLGAAPVTLLESPETKTVLVWLPRVTVETRGPIIPLGATRLPGRSRPIPHEPLCHPSQS